MSWKERARYGSEIHRDYDKNRLKPNVVTYSALIDAHGKKGELHMAVEFYETMKRNRLKPDVVTYNS